MNIVVSNPTLGNGYVQKFFFCSYTVHPVLHSFPTRRSSDLDDNDNLNGIDGNDTFNGGDGNDKLRRAHVSTKLTATNRKEYFARGTSTNVVSGGVGTDTLVVDRSSVTAGEDIVNTPVLPNGG